MSDTHISRLRDFSRLRHFPIQFYKKIRDIAGEAILNYRIEIMNEQDEEFYEYFYSNEFEIDTDNILTLWIDKILEHLFGTNNTSITIDLQVEAHLFRTNTSITFDRKVEMLYSWYQSAEYRVSQLYINNNSEYFADILDNMFENNVVLK